MKQIINSLDSVIDRIKTFGDACCELAIDEAKFNKARELVMKHEMAFAKLAIIVKALNEGWVPNWNNTNEYKYIPYFKMLPFGFVGARYASWATFSGVGSRLCYRTKELAEYAGKQFEQLYKEMMELPSPTF